MSRFADALWAKQYLVEKMFGEFRAPLNDLRAAILAHDTEGALRLFFQLERQTFSIEEHCDGGYRSKPARPIATCSPPL